MTCRHTKFKLQLEQSAKLYYISRTLTQHDSHRKSRAVLQLDGFNAFTSVADSIAKDRYWLGCRDDGSQRFDSGTRTTSRHRSLR